eukprot:gene10507-11611_t
MDFQRESDSDAEVGFLFLNNNCIRGSFHQGSIIFCETSRGRQCGFMTFQALFHNFAQQHVQTWTTSNINDVLMKGDRMYLHALSRKQIPNSNTLSIADLPVVSATGNGTLFSVRYFDCYQGLCRAVDVQPPFWSLQDALVEASTVSSSLIMIISGYMTAIICGENSMFYIFDSHARNNSGLPDAEGTAVLMFLSGIDSLCKHISDLSHSLNTNMFEVVPVLFSALDSSQEPTPTTSEQNQNTTMWSNVDVDILSSIEMSETSLQSTPDLQKEQIISKDNEDSFAASSSNAATTKAEITGFIQKVFPTQKSGNFTYYNTNIQTEQDIIKVKSGRSNYIIDDEAHIAECSSSIGFAYKQPLDTSDTLQISTLSNVALEELVTLKGCIKKLSAVKKIHTQRGPLNKQEGYLVDPSGYIKIVFWEDQVLTVQEGNTYYLTQLRVKKMNNELYVNTAKSGSTIEEVPAYEEPLPEINDIDSLTSITISAEIMGVISINNYKSCYICSRRVTLHDSTAYCQSCKMSVKTRKCTLDWYAKLCFQDVLTKNIVQLALFSDLCQQLASLCSADLDVITPATFTEAILQLDTGFLEKSVFPYLISDNIIRK